MIFSENNQIRCGQDFFQKIGVPNGIDFDVKLIGDEVAELRAPGYGGVPYGNGMIIVRKTMNVGNDECSKLFQSDNTVSIRDIT